MQFERVNAKCIESIKTVFPRLDIEEEEDLSKYNVGLLDVYSHVLSIEDAARLLSSHEQHNLKYEKRFVQTMSRVFQKNGGEVLVYLSKLNLDDTLDEIITLNCSEIVALEYQVINESFM